MNGTRDNKWEFNNQSSLLLEDTQTATLQADRDFKSANLQTGIKDLQLSANKDLLKINHDLRERIKELDCLYGLSKLVEQHGISLDMILQGTTELIRKGWQYPEVTCARIVITDCDKTFKTENFKQTQWKQSAHIKVFHTEAGVVEVYYLEEKPEIDEGPFLKEERNLIEAISERLGRIIERKRAQDALRESEKLAVIGKLAARVAHEINNPLAAIKGSFRLIKGTIPEGHKHYRFIGLIEKEIDRIAQIIRQMYGLYRTKQEIVLKSPDECICEVISLLKGSCEKQNITIELDKKDYADGVKLPDGMFKQILYNLIQNAIDVSSAGQVVMITSTIAGDTLTVAVSDRGGGIPEKLRPRIFEPFFSTKNEQERNGLGMGLSVSKNMVEAMGGNLDFETKVGYGTTFRLNIPIGQKQEDKQND